MKKFKLLSITFIVFLLITLTVISASALDWEGSTAGGGGGGTSATNASFALLNTDYNSVDGYRFSVVDSSGNTVTTSSMYAIDIYRDSTYMSSDYKFSTKYNKSKLIDLQNSGFSTSNTIKYCYSQTEFSFSMPDPDEMDTWAIDKTYLNPILKELGFSNGVDSLAYGYKVLVEPIFHIKLEGTYHALTLTEIALYGKYYLGASSDGGLSYNSGTWGFISTWTNGYFANWLYTSDGMGLWDNAKYLNAAAPTYERATFNTIINSGYGVGIVYAVGTQEEYTVKYYANGGSGAPSSQTKYEDVTLKLSTTVPTKTGYTFLGWGTSASDTSVNYAAGANYTGNANLNLYAIWEVSVVYNANGGTLSSSSYSLTSSEHIQNSSSDKFFHTITYGTSDDPRNATTFGLTKTGYTFVGWSTETDGTSETAVFFNQDTDLSADIYADNVKSGTSYVILYAQWEAYTYKITYDANGGSGAPSAQTKYYNISLTISSTKPTKTGYSFVGWGATATDTGVNYYSGDTFIGNYSCTLYAIWEVSVVYNANGGTLSSSSYSLTSSEHIQNSSSDKFFHKITYGTSDDPYNATTFGLTKTGYTFVGWSTETDGTSETAVFFNQDTDLSADIYADNVKSGTSYVILYAQWEVSVVYNANGGTLSSSSYSLTSSEHIQNSSSDKFFYTIAYGTSDDPRNATTFGLTKTGYTFVGWNTAIDGNGTYFDQSANLSADIYANNVKSGTSYVILYAQWEVSVVYNANGGTLSSSSYSLTSSEHIQNSSSDKFFHTIAYGTSDAPYNATTFGLTKTGYTFAGWNTAIDGNGTYFDQSANLSADIYANNVKSGTSYVILYAQWDQDIINEADVYPEYIEPNSSYRQGTQIIVSFNIVNASDVEFTPSNPIATTFTAVSTDVNGVSTQIYNSVDDVIVPSINENLVYYKIEVPSVAKTLTFTITTEISNSYIETDYDNNTLIIEKETVTVINSQTSDTIFSSTPSDFYLPSVSSTNIPTLGMSVSSSTSWNVWEWENNAFILNTYGVSFEPYINIGVNETLSSTSSNGITTMKSGYGFVFSSSVDITSNGSYTMPSEQAYTTAQNGAVFFPEFNYSSSIGEYRTLEFINEYSSLQFEKNDFSINLSGTNSYNRLHYIPVYYPDGEYEVKSFIYDVWTPIGMLASTATTNSIIIDGSIYDDWYAH